MAEPCIRIEWMKERHRAAYKRVTIGAQNKADVWFRRDRSTKWHALGPQASIPTSRKDRKGPVHLVTVGSRAAGTAYSRSELLQAHIRHVSLMKGKDVVGGAMQRTPDPLHTERNNQAPV